jgi:hypothetical protein
VKRVTIGIPARRMLALLIPAVFAASIALSGCVTRDPSLLQALKNSQVAEIQVETAPEVRTGLPLANGVTQREQISMVVSALQAELQRELKGYPGGPTPARLIVTLHEIDLSSTPGRIIRGNSSRIGGTVRLEEVGTGALIAQVPNLTAADAGVRGDGLAMPVAMAINAMATKDQAHIAQKLAAAFAKNVKDWLTPR